MKNKRNTRRGRAKRWYRVLFSDGTIHYILRKSRTFVSAGPRGRVDVYSLRACVYHAARMSSRAAAMRAAEHLARLK
jgi:hypothetical protein